MGAFKISTQIALVFVAIVGLAFSDVAAEDRWVTLTSFNEVRAMKWLPNPDNVFESSLYMTTSGGLLVAADPNSPPQIFNNLNGLGTVDVSDVLMDAFATLWVCGSGKLVKLTQEGSKVFSIVDNANVPIQTYCLSDEGNFLWIGTSRGLILFSKWNDGGQIQDSYEQFGDLNPQPAVYDIIQTEGDTIWLATSEGLAVANASNPVALKAPTSWTVFGAGEFPILGSGSMSKLARFENEIYLATEHSAFRLDRTVSDTSFFELAMGRDSTINDLVVENDTLFMYYEGGLAYVKGGVFTKLTLPGLPSQNLSTGINYLGKRWVDLANGTVYVNQTGSFEPYLYTGAPGVNVRDVAVNRYAEIAAAMGQQQIGLYMEEAWSQPFQPGASDGANTALADSSGNFWIGTFGNGMWRVMGDSIKNFDENNSTMRGNNDGVRGRSYVVVPGVATDGEYLFVACYRALNGHPIAFCRINEADAPSAWDSIGTPQGLVDTFVTSIDCTPGNLVVGTEGGGIYWCQNARTGDWFTDDYISVAHYTKENRFLKSNAIRCVRFSPDGQLYVGTNFGISWYDLGIDFFVDVELPQGISSDVTDIDFDGRGNMYVATKDGAARRDRNSGQFTTYTTFNSGLVSNDVRSVTVDRFTGDVYFGTSAGISVLLSEVGEPTASLDSVFAYPNPCVMDDANDKVSFNFSRPYIVTIHDLTGVVVRDNINTSSWDGRNDKGEMVASGVYIFVLTDASGVSARGKILLINNR